MQRQGNAADAGIEFTSRRADSVVAIVDTGDRDVDVDSELSDSSDGSRLD